MQFVGDCANCVGLCCVALSRSRAGGFGADIPAGTPCHHLRPDNLCQIHSRLRDEGWPACTVFDCFGAGQQVTQLTFGGDADWRRDPETAASVFGAFGVMRHLMEMLRLLTEARELARDELGPPVRELTDEVQALTRLDAAGLGRVDMAALRGRVGPLLAAVSEQYRAPAPRPKRFVPRAQLLGAHLRGKDLSRYGLRSALLIAADLRGARCHRTDLLGADLRDADLSDADLGGAIFLTQQQVAAARGNAGTRLPIGLTHPEHWS
ncbi:MULTISPECIES: pentapeptide repeat-containing protein [unclassified Luteococcus]|uniref:pentapeptide repeat-containing protein n=1 Tax=unclassified Luteococcus TaxID=2639923 RepID=UPI00313D268E